MLYTWILFHQKMKFFHRRMWRKSKMALKWWKNQKKWSILRSQICFEMPCTLVENFCGQQDTWFYQALWPCYLTSKNKNFPMAYMTTFFKHVRNKITPPPQKGCFSAFPQLCCCQSLTPEPVCFFYMYKLNQAEFIYRLNIFNLFIQFWHSFDRERFITSSNQGYFL